MKAKGFLSVFFVIILISGLSACVEENKRPAMIPSPSSIEYGTGEFTFTHETVISVGNVSQKEIAEWFAWLFARPAGFVPKVVVDAGNADVVLVENSAMGHEEYRMDVGRRNIVIEASAPAGFFYAFQTLRQALPESISSDRHADGQMWTVPVMVLHDVPRFSHRCLSIDVSRHFIPSDELMAFVEYMAMLKLNYLHLSGHGLYSDEELAELAGHASGFHVSVVCGDGRSGSLYTCPDDLVSRIFPNIAALAEVAWSDKDVMDKIGFNRAVDAIDAHLSRSALGCSESVYDIGLACLR